MLSRFASWFACALLRSTVLTDTDRTKLSRVLMGELGALPLKEIIEVDREGNIFMNGELADPAVVKKLSNSAMGALQSYALKFVHDQVMFEAVKLGVHTVETERQMGFARAAIWYGQQETKWLKILAGTDQLPE